MMISVTALSQDREDLRYKERHLAAGLFTQATDFSR